MRIDKLISDMGLASRKEAALIAKRGGVLVDGEPVRDLSRHVDPEKCEIVFKGQKIAFRKYTYVMLNKPAGYVSATDDKINPYVTELLPDELRKMELFPVGRLDKDTVGLMILTNNGVLSHRLLSPKRHVEKDYRFECCDVLSESTERDFENGITLADGYECKPSKIALNADRKSGVITLTEGKYHQIKRMIAASGSRITYLERIRFAEIPLDESLSRGEWRYLTDSEIAFLESLG
jgi:16S rRNA pseudouridine516 synthase